MNNDMGTIDTSWSTNYGPAVYLPHEKDCCMAEIDSPEGPVRENGRTSWEVFICWREKDHAGPHYCRRGVIWY